MLILVTVAVELSLGPHLPSLANQRADGHCTYKPYRGVTIQCLAPFRRSEGGTLQGLADLGRRPSLPYFCEKLAFALFRLLAFRLERPLHPCEASMTS